ncbi:MAG: NAD-dependent epimerase/dehydratase family protein [Candidatus Micrarchaeia archaeon]
MKLLITGATGRLGRILTKTLLKKNHSLRLLVRNTQKAEKLFGKQKKGKLKYVRADFNNPRVLEKINKACKGVEQVAHLAALVTVNAKKEDLEKTNVEFTKTLLKAAEKAKVKRFVFCSSVSVYPERSHTQTYNEEHSYDPSNEYGKSKVDAEKIVKAGKIPFVILRPSMIYGEGFDTGFGSAIRAIQTKKMFTIGRGKNKFAMVHGQDVADAFVKAIERGKQVENKAFIINAEQIEQKTAFELTAKALKVPAPKIQIPKRILLLTAIPLEIISKAFGKNPPISSEFIENLAANRLYSNTRAQKELNWHPKKKFSQEIKKVKTWF